MFIDPFLIPQSNSANIYKINNRYISIILKNASSSIRHHAEQNNNPITSVREIYENNDIADKKTVIDVVIRNPVDRYFSALRTVNHLYKLDDSLPLPHKVERHSSLAGMFIDNHYFPQYFFIYSAYVQSWANDNLYFRFIDIDEVSEIIGDIKKNVSPPIEKRNASVTEKNIIKQKYFYDLKIHNHLIGQTLNYIEVLRFFEQYMEGGFTKKIGLHMPRYIHYLNKINPENHVSNYKKEIAKYKNAFDNFVSEYSKINRD